MIEFYGLVGDYCRKHILKKLIKLSVWGGIGMFILFGIPSIIIGLYFDIWFFLILSSICMIGVIIGSCLTINDKLPKRIIIDKGEVFGEYYKGTGSRLIDDVKEVVDMGKFYDIIFYFPNQWLNCVCQKDLLVEGTIEEFEKLFEDKIVRKTK